MLRRFDLPDEMVVLIRACPKCVAADVRRRTERRFPPKNPPPHVGGYANSTLSGQALANSAGNSSFANLHVARPAVARVHPQSATDCRMISSRSSLVGPLPR